MIISTVHRRHKNRLAGTGARFIDVQPDSGDPEFSLTLDFWEEALQLTIRCQIDELMVMIELAMWVRYMRYSTNWIMTFRNPHLVLMDNCPYVGQGVYTPRAMVALGMLRVMKVIGLKVKLDYEYTDKPPRW